MWLDNASAVDMLFYSPYAETIAEFAADSMLTPMTIGLYGSWGAGKSSLLNLIETNLKGKKVECISLNAWQFEGYEDAKIAIMEALLHSLNNIPSFTRTVGEKIKGLLSRIDYLKIGKNALTSSVPFIISALSGNPIPALANITSLLKGIEGIEDVIAILKEAVKSSGDDTESLKEKLKDGFEKYNTLKSEYLKNKEEETQTENIRAFRNDFEDMLNSAKEIDNLVVIVDDLDRCSPERIIETLEAIKLFLSVKKTTFIIAVDQRIIEYAVRNKYPRIEGYDLSMDYIEKIIQLPIKIPELSHKDIENYLLLLILQLHLTEDAFENVINKINDEKLLLSDEVLTWEKIKSYGIVNARTDIVNDADFDDDCKVIETIRGVVSTSLKGNPRQTKRFLNTFFVRKRLAKLYFGTEFDLTVMAKLLALEFIDISAFRKLFEWSKEYDGQNEKMKNVEISVGKGEILENENKIWDKPRLLKWITSEPREFYKYDLSKYYYLSRESLVNTENVDAAFNEIERKMLSLLVECKKGRETSYIEELKKLELDSQNRVIEGTLVHFRNSNISLAMISYIYCEFPEFQEEIGEIIKSKETKFFNAASEIHLKKMSSANNKHMKSLLDSLHDNGKIKDDARYRILKE